MFRNYMSQAVSEGKTETKIVRGRIFFDPIFLVKFESKLVQYKRGEVRLS